MKSLEQRIFELEQKVAELSKLAERPQLAPYRLPQDWRPGVILPASPEPPFIVTCSETAK